MQEAHGPKHPAIVVLYYLLKIDTFDIIYTKKTS